jgi:hypothetical protein
MLFYLLFFCCYDLFDEINTYTSPQKYYDGVASRLRPRNDASMVAAGLTLKFITESNNSLKN